MVMSGTSSMRPPVLPGSQTRSEPATRSRSIRPKVEATVTSRTGSASSPLPPGGELLDATVVETGALAAPILDVDLGEVAAGAQRRAQYPLKDGFLDHRSLPRLEVGKRERG